MSSPATSSPTPAPIAYDTLPLPADPAAALLLASKANGLGREGLKPWYLKAHYQTYDPQGKPKDVGVLELYWMSTVKYRSDFASDSFKQTFYKTENGNYRQGSEERLPYSESQLLSLLFYPVSLPDAKATLKWAVGAPAGYKCLQVSNGQPMQDIYFFDVDKLTLRSTQDTQRQVVFNKLAMFQHRYIARNIRVFDEGLPVVTLDVDELKTLTNADLQSFTPPGDATLLTPLQSALSGGMHDVYSGKSIFQQIGFTPAKLLKSDDSEYLAEARRRQLTGTVKLTVHVSPEGKVIDTRATRDPNPVLTAAALKCVSKFRFQPALYEGKAVESYVFFQLNSDRSRPE